MNKENDRYGLADVALGLIARWPAQVIHFRLVRFSPDSDEVIATPMLARFGAPAANDETVNP